MARKDHLPWVWEVTLSLAELLKAARVGADLTQTKAACLLEVNHTTLWRWETSRTVPTAGHLEKLMGAYGLNPVRREALRQALLSSMVSK
jgi:transcriptional regulator with XRE-family HTH domain